MDISYREKHNLETIYPYLGECTLFLARDDSFPLSKPCSIAAYGRGVRHTIKGGSGSGDVNSRFFITIEEGLEKAGFVITSKEWLEEADRIHDANHPLWIKETKKKAKQFKTLSPIFAIGRVMPEVDYNLPLSFTSDAAIYVISRMSGEGSDREFISGDILLTESEIRDIKELNKRYSKFMLVINAGGIVDLSPVLEVRNILILSELGTETGRVLADILLGKINPSGKLASTWAKIDDYPYSKEVPLHDTYYKEGRYVGYRYFDSFNIKPLFPFGYGLSYTDFKIDNYSISNDGKSIRVKARVTNIRKHDGKEVVQAYLSHVGKEEKVYQELAGFSKTHEIKSGDNEEVIIDIDLRDLAKYDRDRRVYYLEAGDYIVRVGNSSKNTVPAAIICLEEEIITKEAKNIYNQTFVDEIKTVINIENTKDLPKICVKQKDFEVIKYHKETLEIPEVIKRISTRELINMNTGLVGNQHSLSFIGESSITSPGAAGEISSDFVKHFRRNVVMADGPAGVRLTRNYYRKGSKVKKLDFNPFLMEPLEFLPGPLRFILKKILIKKVDPKKVENIYHQYCTAMPIATAVAQSFNKELAYTIGDIVGNEMKEYKIDLWLAPAMNLQRTIMCGRNFEYYSEDPLLTAMMAAQVVKGVQSHPHKGAVIKHFAANNQETFRFVSNSVVNEDTLRELYLRAFEIVIREASPKGVMSSYNLVNGEHSGESIGLISEFLYDENAYQGIVMTDWIIRGSKPPLAKHKASTIVNVYKASTSLFMPGSKYDIKQLSKDIKRHPENRAYLEKNATRLFNNFAKK